MTRKQSFGNLCEALEPRMFMSASTLIENGILRVLGDPDRCNNITVEINPADSGKDIVVWNGDECITFNTSDSDIYGIDIQGGDKKDKIRLTALDVMDAQDFWIGIYGNPGNDVINVDTTLPVEAHGEDGNDTIKVFGIFAWNFAYGEDGNDKLTVSGGGEAHGGAGNDKLYSRGSVFNILTGNGGRNSYSGSWGRTDYYLGEEPGSRDTVKGGTGVDVGHIIGLGKIKFTGNTADGLDVAKFIMDERRPGDLKVSKNLGWLAVYPLAPEVVDLSLTEVEI